MAKYSCQTCSDSFQFQQDLDKHKVYEHSGRHGANSVSRSADRPSRYEGNTSKMSQIQRMSAHESVDQRIPDRNELDEIRTVEEPYNTGYNRRPDYNSRISTLEIEDDLSTSDSDSSDDEDEEVSVEKQLDALREECIPLRKKLHERKFKTLLNDLDKENARDKIKASTKGMIV